MNQNQYEQQYKKTVIDFFDSRIKYDNEHTINRTLPILKSVKFGKGQRILDIATGTGLIAINAAERVGNEGKVVGVDFSSIMLQQAKQKIDDLKLENIELIQGDAEYIDFENESFDIITCSTALVYFRDIPKALQNWYKWLKKGGVIAFSCGSEKSYAAPIIIKAAAKHGISLLNINEPTGTPEKCHHLMQLAGFQDIEIKSKQFGFYQSLDEAKQWNGSWSHPHENPLLEVSPEKMEELKADFQQLIEVNLTERGVWYEALMFFVKGHK
ncbi:methyltransferase domain-containing protein [Mastigocoleus sp. MO_188.B34]|uniref:methyltransferase domain-containing protein n=1 Tax=Mastigocoleus sp. MO_188.B34 TaxID=3036635 RepID=UPI0026287AE9|nr:methyltransferase domain-containing protein [Mastigocoleus sp. MO_188.B34]MDJ0696446.1 methyltransferase domain-containing protein [Mastigocoleus sp. MO_188.B34]